MVTGSNVLMDNPLVWSVAELGELGSESRDSLSENSFCFRQPTGEKDYKVDAIFKKGYKDTL